MNAQDIVLISGAVVILTQFVKWQGMRDSLGPLVVLLLAAIGVGVWGWSKGNLDRTVAFDFFAGWLSVALNAAGIFGFTRAASSAVTKATAPPQSGAGSSPTVKDNPR